MGRARALGRRNAPGRREARPCGARRMLRHGPPPPQGPRGPPHRGGVRRGGARCGATSLGTLGRGPTPGATSRHLVPSSRRHLAPPRAGRDLRGRRIRRLRERPSPSSPPTRRPAPRCARNVARAEVPSLRARLDLRRQGREGIRRAVVLADTQSEGVDARREALERAIPAKGDGPGPPDDALGAPIDEQGLKARIARVERTEVPRRMVPVPVVLRPDAFEEAVMTHLLPQLPPLGGRPHLEPVRHPLRRLHPDIIAVSPPRVDGPWRAFETGSIWRSKRMLTVVEKGRARSPKNRGGPVTPLESGCCG